ncbi:hypothetical protein MKW92_010737 [Papaver armeniacum]|nr:hypothetical protein MKW92_010737 [Papaver armeniacum]
MASFLGLRIVYIVALLWSLLLTYHVPVLVEGRVDMATKLTQEEELNIERQLRILNKPPTKTIHAPWGDTYDCIEFHKQPTFDHPLLKHHKTKMNEEFLSANSTKTSMNQVDGCLKGTVPIRRTTREDFIRAKLSSNALADQYRAGVSYQAKLDETIHGASGIFNVWNPSVHQDQFSSAEIALQSGSQEQTNVIKYGWTVNPQLYGDDVTRSFAYWTADGGHNTGCYNTRCHGFVQTHSVYTPDMHFSKMSEIGGEQVMLSVHISLDKLEGKWWLILGENIQIGYWPKELLPGFTPGATSVFWGGRVKSSQDGSSPPMGSGQPISALVADAGSVDTLRYINMDNKSLKPEKTEDTIDCPDHYEAEYYPDHNTLHFGGRGGPKCEGNL